METKEEICWLHVREFAERTIGSLISMFSPVDNQHYAILQKITKMGAIIEVTGVDGSGEEIKSWIDDQGCIHFVTPRFEVNPKHVIITVKA